MLDVIGIGDLHFDKLHRLLPYANNWIAHEVNRVFRYAVKQGVKRIWFYGDICERPRMSYEAHIAFMNTLFSEYTEKHGLEYAAILGNHDFEEEGRHSLQLVETFARLVGRKLQVYTTTEEEEIDGVPIRWCPYPERKTSADHLNVIHHEVDGSIGDNGRKQRGGENNTHTCIAGHLHTPHKIRQTHYSGTLYQTSFGESLPKAFHHVQATYKKGKLDVKVKSVPFKPSIELVNLEVNTLKDLKAIDAESTVEIAGVARPAKLYKLFVHDGIKGFDATRLQDYPNVIRTNVFSTKEELEEMMLERELEEGSDDTSSLFSPQDDLAAFFDTRKVDKGLRKQALNIHDRLVMSALKEK